MPAASPPASAPPRLRAAGALLLALLAGAAAAQELKPGEPALPPPVVEAADLAGFATRSDPANPGDWPQLAQEQETAGASQLKAPAAELARGKASWYGQRFHGRRTSSGERFDMHALTAAHPHLPFGTRIKVRNLANGREVVVRINDRGPLRSGRIIDLSQAAARTLGILRAGTAQVVLLHP